VSVEEGASVLGVSPQEVERDDEEGEADSKEAEPNLEGTFAQGSEDWPTT
jgi:hypothetical protein